MEGFFLMERQENIVSNFTIAVKSESNTKSYRNDSVTERLLD